MLERAVENWLAKAGERAFQVPFCYMLSREGYTVVHVSRHCGMELGKDVLAVDGDGTPCAFQLKGGDISLKKWRDEVSKQVTDLVYGRIKHPSFDASEQHRSFLVTNGKLEEEVWRAIDDLNDTLEDRNMPKLETRVGGELVGKAIDLQSDLWPSELVDAKDLLELYLHDGRDVFPKAKLAGLLESTLPFEEGKSGRVPSKPACDRAVASAAVLTALSLSSFTEEENHVAEVEAWTLYVAYVLALVERWGLEEERYEHEVEIALKTIRNSLENLAHEVEGRKHLVEGMVTVDGPFLGVRITWVTALLCVLGLWRRAAGEERGDADEIVRRFVDENLRRLLLWGEAAVPQYLAIYWYDRLINARSGRADGLLYALADAVTRSKLGGGGVLPDPYYEAKDWMPYILDAELEGVVPHHYRLTKEPPPDFAGYSHVLEGLLHLLVQQNWKRRTKDLWPDVTKIALHRFDVREPWHFYRWRNEGEGKAVMDLPEHTRQWDELKAEASDASGTGLPELIKKQPLFALLFTIVYPHRADATILRWLNPELKRAVYGTGA